MEHEYTVQDFLKQFGFDGGPGSGNWGHAGRTGKRGGSAKVKGGSAAQSGGKQFRAYEASKGYYGIKKTQHFASATQKASKTFSYNRWQRNLTEDQKTAIKNQHEHIVSVSGYKEDLESYQRRIYSMMRGGAEQERRPQGKPVTVTAEQACSKFQRNRKDQPSQITDVVHQQGFDGPAKVVSKKQMDEMLKADPTRPVFYRSYVAPDKQTLDAYDDCAQHASWYIECTDGGAQYGRGMYSAGVYESGAGTRYSHKSKEQRQQGALREMKHYLQTNKRRVKESTTPKDGIQRLFYTDDIYVESQKHTIDETPNQGQIVAIKGSAFATMLAKFQGGKFIQCERSGEKARWAREFTPDQLKRRSYAPTWQKMSDWKPQPAGTVRKFMLQPDANILVLHSKWGDKKQMNALVKKANAQLKKRAFTRLPKDQVSKQVSETLDNYTYNPKDAILEYDRRVKSYQTMIDQDQSFVDKSLAAGVDPTSWRIKSAQSRIIFRKNQIQQCTKKRGQLKDIIDSYPTEDGFYKKIAQQRKWKTLHAYLGKKACPYKEQTFTPEQQAFLNQRQQTYKTGIWKTYLSIETKDSIEDNFVRDAGSAAALLGYDAINAIDHGQSGSYTVILNRTKVIYQDEQIDMSGVAG